MAEDRKDVAAGDALANAVERALQGDVAALQAELMALAQLMPGMPGVARPAPMDDSEIESMFDNMPV